MQRFSRNVKISSCWHRLVCLVLLSGITSFVRGGTVTLDAADYTSAKNLSTASMAKLEESGYLTGQGEVSYPLAAAEDGWYTLWIGATTWPADLFLDGKFLMRTAFETDAWPAKDGANRIGNLFLTRGTHTLLIRKLSPPGLPWISKLTLEPARDITAKARAVPVGDDLVRRAGEEMAVTLTAAKLVSSYRLKARVFPSGSTKPIDEQLLTVPAGQGQFEARILLPTSTEGAFRFILTDSLNRNIDKGFEFVVVDTKTRSKAETLSTTLVQTIVPSSQLPDYQSTGATVVSNPGGLQFIQSGPRGEIQARGKGDYFAYALKVPTTQELYMVQVDYPDNADRAFSVSIVEDDINPYSLDAGVVTGGNYPTAGRNQTLEIYFFPRQKNPRILFLNWQNGGRAAASAIRVYKVASGLPEFGVVQSGRELGIYLEETLRFTTYFGSTSEGNTWGNLLLAANRYAQWSKFSGVNSWRQASAAYQTALWPARTIPGFGADDEPDFGKGVVGPVCLTDYFQKDVLKLMMLIGEKYGIGVVPELSIPPNEMLKKQLDAVFGGRGTISDNSGAKPWLTVSKDGQVGLNDPFYPYFNPVHPSVRNWVGSVVSEVASRYKDSSAFKGVALRMMGWSLGSWQAYPSISWGYEDYSIKKFASDTGISVPLGGNDPGRYQMRYEWLAHNAYEEWLTWRTAQIAILHQSLASALQQTRPDLRLFLDSFGPHYSMPEYWDNAIAVDMWRKKGWHRLVRESGIDPDRYRTSTGIVFSNATFYPPGARNFFGLNSRLSKELYEYSNDPSPIELSEKGAPPAGTVAFSRFYNHYMEADFPFANVGLKGRGNAKSFRVVGLLNPAGDAMKQRYAQALASGNIVSFIDGGLGYVLGQPKVMSAFFRNYLNLPNVPMQRLAGTPSSVTIWGGYGGRSYYFYVVNPTGTSKRVTLAFGRAADASRIDGTPLAYSADRLTATFNAGGFDLIAFKCSGQTNCLLSSSFQ